MLDSGRLYIPIIILTIYFGFIHFLAMSSFPPFIGVMIFWYLFLRNLNDDGKYVKYTFLVLFIDYLAFTFQVGEEGIQGLVYVIYAPLGIMFILMIFLYIAVRKETFYYNRTIKGMNTSDQKRARKAFKTKDPNDFQEVAKYVDWNQVS